jgi:hypothetical protein
LDAENSMPIIFVDPKKLQFQILIKSTKCGRRGEYMFWVARVWWDLEREISGAFNE